MRARVFSERASNEEEQVDREVVMRWSRLAALGILIGGGSAAAIVLVSSKPALALPFTFRATDSCCNYTYSGTCDARPGNPDPRCKSGRKAAGDNADFGCGCAGDPNACIPNIATAEIPELPNNRDDDCDGFIDDEKCDGVDNDGDGQIDEDEGSCLLRL